VAGRYERRHERGLGRAGGKAWGTFRIPEQRLQLLGDVRGKDVLELGCGAAWWSIALARDGARVIGLDFSERRLEQAAYRMRAAGLEFPLVRARAERIPYPSERFDVVLSDYGATTFADPLRVVPEVARVLRPGGVFVFAHAHPLRSAAEGRRHDRLTRRLVHDYFELHRIPTYDTVEFQLPFGRWIALFGSAGLSVERIVEPRASPALRSPYVTPTDGRWAEHWPFEAIWKVRKPRTDGPSGNRVSSNRDRGR
jgi:SAM-dependent methyltransferase